MNFYIDPGEFRNLVEIQRYTKGKDDENRPKSNWKSLFVTKAKVMNVRGEEFIEAKGIGSKIAKTFYIRASRSKVITNKDRVLYKGIPCNILYVNDVEDRGRYLEIKTEYIE